MRGLESSPAHQLQTRRKSETLQKLFRKFDLNGDGELSAKEFVTALRTMNSQLSDHKIRTIARDIDADGDGVVDYHEFSAQLAADASQLPLFLKGKRWHDSGDIVNGRDESHAEEVRRNDKQRYLRGMLKQHEGEDGVVDGEQLADALRRLNSYLTPEEVSKLTQQVCGEGGAVRAADFAEASTRNQTPAFLLSKRHRDNGAILAWPEPEGGAPPHARTPRGSQRGAARATPADKRASPGGRRANGSPPGELGSPPHRRHSLACGGASDERLIYAGASLDAKLAALEAALEDGVEPAHADAVTPAPGGGADDAAGLELPPRTAGRTPVGPNFSKRGSLKATAADPAAGAASSRVVSRAPCSAPPRVPPTPLRPP